MPGPDPMVHRRRLRGELRKMREAADRPQREVAAAMEWSTSKLIRIEAGMVTISRNDLSALLSYYEVTDPTRVNQLVEMARAARERSWASRWREVASAEYVAFLGYESSASVIRNFEPIVVPGLLQTDEYSREVLQGLHGEDAPEKIAPLLDLRLERQELLIRDNPSSIHFIMDEAAIRRMVGGADVMRRQLSHLRRVAEYPRVTIRIMPFRTGIYPRLGVPYVLFEFPDLVDENILYLESPRGEMIIRENEPEEQSPRPASPAAPPAPATYLSAFWQLEALAPPEDTPTMIDAALQGLAEATDP